MTARIIAWIILIAGGIATLAVVGAGFYWWAS